VCSRTEDRDEERGSGEVGHRERGKEGGGRGRGRRVDRGRGGVRAGEEIEERRGELHRRERARARERESARARERERERERARERERERERETHKPAQLRESERDIFFLYVKLFKYSLYEQFLKGFEGEINVLIVQSFDFINKGF
jgi:hypothetical protein